MRTKCHALRGAATVITGAGLTRRCVRLKTSRTMRAIRFPRIALGLFLAAFAAVIFHPPARCAETQRLDLGGGTAMEIVRIEPGSFSQGSPASEAQRGGDETPRTVTLTQPFYLGKFPVTRGEFARFADETRYRTEAESGPSGGYGWDGAKLAQRREFTWRNPGFPQTDTHPVVLVTYADAHAFLMWLSRKSGRTFALPSEAQWEYACRAGGTTAFSDGGKGRSARLDGTQPVGQALNAWGLGDMTGNVWQWCEDWYAPYAGGSPTDPLQTQSNLSDKPRRVIRGGSWLRDAAALRSAARYRNDAASRNADNGFRVMTFDAEPTANQAPKPAADRQRVIAPVQNAAPDRIVPIAPPVTQPAHFSSESAPFPSARRGFPFIGLLFGGVIIFIILAVVVSIIRAIAKSGATGLMPGNLGPTGNGGALRTRIADDGFWIESASLPVGTVLECRFSAGGKQNQINVTFQGAAGGQFVFTGSRPSNVVVAVLPGGGPTGGGSFGGGSIGGSSLGRAAGMMTGMHQPPLHDDDDRERFRSHPPAY